MTYIKKITGEQFAKDVINFELKKYGVTIDDILKLPHVPTDGKDVDPNVTYQEGWYQRYTFDSWDEFIAWRTYFYEHYKDWQPKRKWKKYIIVREFEWFNLDYGLKTNYELDQKKYSEVADEIYEKVFGKNK